MKKKLTANLEKFIETAFSKIGDLSGKNMNLARKKFVNLFVVGLISSRSVQFCEIADKMDTESDAESNLRRIQRFMADYEMDYFEFAYLLLCLIPPKGKVKLCVDRTNWEFGDQSINILVVSVFSHGVGVPIWFELLDNEGGNSDTDDRIRVLKQCVKILGKDRIAAIIGDREFIGVKWIRYLLDEKIPFFMRIRQNQYLEVRGQKIKCETLMHGRHKLMLDGVEIFDQSLSVAMKRLKKCTKSGKSELLIVVTNTCSAKALTEYKNRWSIEVLFQALKKRGFDLESTHLKQLDRVRKLFALVSLAYTLCFTFGVNENNHHKPIEVKKHGYKANSFFRTGLNCIRDFIMDRRNDLEIFLNEIFNLFSNNFMKLEKNVT